LFYKNLADNKTQNNNGIPNINEIKEFWSNTWSNEVQFNNQAEWIPNLENEIPDSNNPHLQLLLYNSQNTRYVEQWVTLLETSGLKLLGPRYVPDLAPCDLIVFHR
jgi:hypothetical protein